MAQMLLVQAEMYGTVVHIIKGYCTSSTSWINCGMAKSLVQAELARAFGHTTIILEQV